MFLNNSGKCEKNVEKRKKGNKSCKKSALCVVGVAEVVVVVAAELDVLYYFQTKSEVFYLRPSF